MTAGFGDVAFVQHQDAVGVDDAGQAVGQDHGGAADHEPVEGGLDDGLVLGIDGGERLVQHQDGGVAQQGPGDGNALALPAGEAGAAFADHGLIAVGQGRDEFVGVGGAGNGGEFGLGGIRAAETEIFLHGAVEQVGVLRNHRDRAADCVGLQSAQVAVADADGAGLRVVEAEQQADDGGFAGAAGADDADALAGGDGEGERAVGGAAGAGIGEADIFEADAGVLLHFSRYAGGSLPPTRSGVGSRCDPGEGGGSRRGDLRVQQGVDAGSGGLAVHALVQDGSQVAQRTENLGAGHEHDQQGGQAHFAVLDAPDAQRQGGGGAEAAAEIGDAAGHDALRQHPERAGGQGAGAFGEAAPVGGALAEGFQGGQALDGVEEFLAEFLHGALALDRGLARAVVGERREQQGEQGGGQHHGGHGQVPERDEQEDRQRGANGDGDLGQVLAEEGLQLLDAIDHGQHDAAGALGAEPCGTEGDDLVVEPGAQGFLHAGGGAVGDHGARVIEPGAQQDAGGGGDQGPGELRGRVAAEHAGEEAAEKGESGDADEKRQQADQDRGGDAAAQPAGEAPEPEVEMQGSLPFGADWITDRAGR